MSSASIVPRFHCRSAVGLLVACLAAPICISSSISRAADRAPDDAGSVALFEAVRRGDVTTKVVMRNAYIGRVMLRNTTRQPVSVELPAVFAAQPVLAQVGNFPFGGNQGSGSFLGQGNNSGRQAPQTVAGPFSFSSSNSSNQNQNNIFNIPPESVREIRLHTVCIEHGKPNPKTTVAYELVPFEQVSDDPVLAAVLERYGRGDLDRDVVQAAAWHLANEKSWDELARMSRTIAVNAQEPIFSAGQLYSARKMTEAAEKIVSEREEQAWNVVAKPAL